MSNRGWLWGLVIASACTEAADPLGPSMGIDLGPPTDAALMDVGGRDAEVPDLERPDVSGAPDLGGPATPCFDRIEGPHRVVEVPADCPADPDFTDDLPRTPAASYFGEVAAIEASDQFHAPWASYLRTREEVCRIFEAVPDLQVFEHPGVNKDLRPDFILIPEDDATRRQMLEGRYPPWRCLGPRLGLRTAGTSFNRRPAVEVYIAGVFDRRALERRLRSLPGVQIVTTRLPYGGTGAFSCIFERDGAHHYVLSLIDLSSLPAGETRVWYFEARGSDVQLLGTHAAPGWEEPPSMFTPPECDPSRM